MGQVVVVVPQANGDRSISNLTPSDLFQNEMTHHVKITGRNKAHQSNGVINSMEPSIDSGLVDGGINIDTKLGNIMSLIQKDQTGEQLKKYRA